jgi:hypothetical protein
MNQPVRRRVRALLAAALLGVVALEAPAIAAPTLAAPPSNDSISTATRLTTPPARYVVDTSQATASSTDGSCVQGRSVWFRTRPARTRTVQFSTVGSDYDTVLAVFRGSRANHTRIACADDSFDTSAAATRRVRMVAGATYWIAVSACCSKTAAGGHLVLNTFLPAPAGLTATVDRVQTGAVSGRLIVHGTARCTTPSELEVDLVASQRVGGGGANVASGGGSVLGTCGPKAGRWTATLDSQTGWAFQARPISVTLDAFANDGYAAATVGPETATFPVTTSPNALSPVTVR